MRRVPISAAIPAVASVVLSASALGRHAYWQDAGFYLTAVHQFVPLYPPGFMLYVLLCKAWTLLLFFVDFTLAVHLFSAACAAGAAACIGLAGRELLLLRWGEGERPGAETAGASAGVLAAAGFTFWFSGLYAKGYALLYLVLGALVWRMLRAAATRRPRDFTIVAALIGLSWQAHPSATCAGVALALFAWRFGRHLGARGIAWRTLLAAACALGPSILIPFLARRDVAFSFGEPSTLGEWLSYLLGQRFVGREGVFGFIPERWLRMGLFFWEEFLLVGGLAAAWGLSRAGRVWVVGALAWTLPYVAVPTLFTLEGQQDHWYVAAWIPLWVAAAVGIHDLARRAGAKGRRIPAGVAAAGLAWAVVANHPDLDQRGYDLAEAHARMHLAPLAPRAIVMATSDETSGLGHFLQLVRGERPDVLIVRRSHLWDASSGGGSWYDRRLLRRDPSLRLPDYAGMQRRFPGASREAVVLAAFADANVGPDRPVYFEEPPPLSMIRTDYAAVPAGPLLKLVPRGREAPEEHPLPYEPSDVRARFRRERGQALSTGPDGRLRSTPEAYENWFLAALLRARMLLGEWHFERRAFDRAAPLYESIVRADPVTFDLPEVAYPLGVSLAAVGRAEDAQAVLTRALRTRLEPAARAGALEALAELRRAAGDPAAARRLLEEAVRVPGLPPAVKADLERRLGR